MSRASFNEREGESEREGGRTDGGTMSTMMMTREELEWLHPGQAWTGLLATGFGL